ncbi:MAG: peptide chain release factor N(5)-glutamine methyltransferase [Clostridia bacterium]|nr:peptide chain release factor N(5)-glutamine methyltransferase [Clostridia bacterium]
MTPQELIRRSAHLLERSGVPDARLDASYLLEHVTGRHALMLRLDRETPLSADEMQSFSYLLERRCAREPLQYLLHSQSFLGHPFYVDQRVLIPRQETELLCEIVIEYLCSQPDSHTNRKVLDLCCGSGCIGLSLLLSCPTIDVTLADLSADALDVARYNAERLHARVHFSRGDLFEGLEDRYCLIVSNPPYIPTEECTHLQSEVLKEPRMALDGGKSGLDFYARIAQEAPEHLYKGGALFLEIGSDQRQAVSSLLEKAGFCDIRAYPDLQGLDRMISARWA